MCLWHRYAPRGGWGVAGYHAQKITAPRSGATLNPYPQDWQQHHRHTPLRCICYHLTSTGDRLSQAPQQFQIASINERNRWRYYRRDYIKNIFM